MNYLCTSVQPMSRRREDTCQLETGHELPHVGKHGEWWRCDHPHPTDIDRYCIYDNAHPETPHADGLGAFPEPRKARA